MADTEQDENPAKIRQLYPGMSNERLREAQVNYRRYLAVLLRMPERLQNEASVAT